MSLHKTLRANQHNVKHTFSGKRHFFEVTTLQGETYNVSFQANCDCKFMGTEGVAQGKLCSHIMAVFKSIIGVKNE